MIPRPPGKKVSLVRSSRTRRFPVGMCVMDLPKTKLPLIEQREIEARIVGPLIRAFALELGQERTLAVVKTVIRELARESGGALAAALGATTIEAFASSLDRWSENGALEIDILERSATQLSFNVT